MTAKDPWTEVSRRFNEIIRRCDSKVRPTSLPHVEQVVFYVVATRCEIDINGFASVFEQLLTATEARFLVRALNEIGASDLASCFQEAITEMEAAGFELGNDRMANYSTDLDSRIESIGQKVQQDERMWQLDPKLCQLFANG
jgi:hypothetical protein